MVSDMILALPIPAARPGGWAGNGRALHLRSRNEADGEANTPASEALSPTTWDWK